MLMDVNEEGTEIEDRSDDFVQYYFDIEVDTEIFKKIVSHC